MYDLCREESSRELRVGQDRPHGRGRGGDGGQAVVRRGECVGDEGGGRDREER